MLRSFPLIILAIVIYNVLVFGAPVFMGADFQGVDELLARHVSFTMFSGEVWNFSLGDFLVVLTLLLLFVEVVKATRTSAIEVINHGLSTLTFIVALVEFITLRDFATSTFFLISAMAVFDVVAGFTISIVAAKRDLGVAGGLIGTN
jgi:hypothetical protein